MADHPRDRDTDIDADLDKDLNADIDIAALTHGLLPAHTPLFLSMAGCINRQSGLYHASFGSSWLRDYYLDRLISLLESANRDILMLDSGTDIVELLNPRLEKTALRDATRKINYDTSAAVLIVKDATTIAAETWTLLFALMRDLPVLNLACLACWLPEQTEQQEHLSTQCREFRTAFSFDLDEASAEVDVGDKKVL
jgi:hypothetical protein